MPTIVPHTLEILGTFFATWDTEYGLLGKIIFSLTSARKYVGCLDGDPGFRKIASK